MAQEVRLDAGLGLVRRLRTRRRQHVIGVRMRGQIGAGRRQHPAGSGAQAARGARCGIRRRHGDRGRRDAAERSGGQSAAAGASPHHSCGHCSFVSFPRVSSGIRTILFDRASLFTALHCRLDSQGPPDRGPINEGYVHLGNPQLKAPRRRGKGPPGCEPVGAGSPHSSRPSPWWRADRLLELREKRRTARLQRPARVADQGVDRRLHQGDRDQGDLPPGRRHRARQPADRRGRRHRPPTCSSPRTPPRWPPSRRPACSPTWTPTPSLRCRRSTVRRPASGPASPRAPPSSSTTRRSCNPISCPSR